MHRMTVYLLLLVLAVTPAFGGWEYTATTQAEGGRGSEGMRSSIKGLADGAKSRVEFLDSGNPMMPAGSYMVSSDGGSTIYLVNPKQKSYAVWDVESMMGMAGGAMQMMGMKFSTPKVEKLLEEKGPAIHGFPTTHYRYRSSYTMEVNFMGIRRSTETINEEDVWATTDIKDEGMGVWLKQKTMKTGNEELDKLLEAEMSKIKGFPLKRVVVTTSKQSDGSSETMRMTSEITSIKKSAVPASVFDVPKDYTEESMFPDGGLPTGGSGGPGAGQGDSGAGDNPFLKMLQQRK